MGGNDTLVGNSTSEDTFGFGSGSGRDTIENFGDRLTITDNTAEFVNYCFKGKKIDSQDNLSCLISMNPRNTKAGGLCGYCWWRRSTINNTHEFFETY